MLTFDSFTAELTRRLIENTKLVESLAHIGIAPEDWPECDAKALWLSFKENKNKVAAKIALLNDARWLRLKAIECELPSQPQELFQVYKELVEEQKTIALATELLASPRQRDEILARHRSGTIVDNEAIDTAEAMAIYVSELKEKQMKGNAIKALPNWPELTRSIGGFNEGRVGIIVADSGYGKTALASQLSLDASASMPVLYMNMEMTPFDFTHRLLASKLDVPLRDLYGYKVDSILETALRGHALLQTRGQMLSLMDISRLIAHHKDRDNIEFVVVDYDQKIALEGKDEEWRELQRAVIWLEELAKKHSVYIILLAQSNFNEGISGSKRMTFSASTVLHFGEDKDGNAIIKALKNRWGPRRAAIQVNYEPEKSRLTEGGKWICS